MKRFLITISFGFLITMVCYVWLSFPTIRRQRIDRESRRIRNWIPAFAGMTESLLIRYASVIFFITVFLAPAVENNLPDDDASIVEVIAVCQEFDARIPWRKKPPEIRQGLAVVVEGNQVLTFDGIVRNSNLIEIRRARTGTKLEAKTIVADEQIGAALLKIADEKAAAQFKSVPIADKVRRNDLVTIVKMDASGQFQTDEGQVIEVISSPRGLLFKVLTDLGIEKKGTPVFLNNTRPGSPRGEAGEDRVLAGIVINYDKSTQTCTVLSATTLKKFLAGALALPYAGSAWAGLTWEPLLDPAKRKYLGVDGQKGGVLVVRTAPGSGAAAVLQNEDVIVEIDGYQLDEMGYYSDPDFGRLLFTYLINGRHSPGENAALTIFRNRRKITAQMLLKRQSDIAQIIPENTAGAQGEYLAEGGLILRELTGDYLRAGGREWIIQNNPRLVYYYFNPWQFSNKEGEHLVVLSGVLPDQINIGYEYRDEVVTAVNGRPVRRLADVFKVVDQDGGLKRVSLMGYEIDLVLDEQEMAGANRRIAANYRIPSMRYQRPEERSQPACNAMRSIAGR
ncbi:MAG: hypothetical protein Q7J98_05700 [Kiritimatiellia bacterium]|nr:hypothetical protein [Kiritimatiellia bacterium]